MLLTKTGTYPPKYEHETIESAVAEAAWQLGEGGTCRKLKVSTNVRATFAKLLVI